MSRRVLATLAAAATAVGALLAGAHSDAAQAAARPISVLRIAMTPISSLDGSHGTPINNALSSLGLERLTTVGADGNVHPWLAQSISQPGKAVYVYHLRHGVKFWDGNELTADDVANSLNYQRYPGSVSAYNFQSVKSITARDRYTVVVTLKHPDPGWRFLLCRFEMGIFEKKFQQAHKSTFGQPGTMTMGTGPWKFDSFDPTTGAELSANPSWWGGKVPIQRLSVKFIADQSGMALAFRAGAIDVTPTGITDVTGFTAAAQVPVLTAPSNDELDLAMNTQAAPWSDVHVRRAVAYALNRTAMIKANGGGGSPIAVIAQAELKALGSAAQVQALLRSLPQYPLDLARAKQELAKSAYPHGFTYTIDVPPLANLPTLTQALAGQLQPIGITIKVNNVSIGLWYDELTHKDKRQAGLVPYTDPSPDPSNLFGSALDSKNTVTGQFNIANYAVPAVDALLDAGQQTGDRTKRLAIYQKLLTKVATDEPYVPIWSGLQSYPISSKLSLQGFNQYFFGFRSDWPLYVVMK
jgi:peptide/nickel transport system substrate-binding protein